MARAKKTVAAPKVDIGMEVFAALRDLEKTKGIPVDYMVERMKQGMANASVVFCRNPLLCHMIPLPFISEDELVVPEFCPVMEDDGADITGADGIPARPHLF